MKLGYLDTMRSFNKLQGHIYYFKPEELSVSHNVSGWSTHCSRANGMAVRCVEDK